VTLAQQRAGDPGHADYNSWEAGIGFYLGF
jgi:hypothetical protein